MVTHRHPTATPSIPSTKITRGGNNPTPGVDNTIDPVSSLTPATITSHTTRYLGATAPDGEGVALYSANADGDDTTNIDDEDGVMPQQSPNATPLQFWAEGTDGGRVEVTATGGNAWLVGVFDFNRDGQFDVSSGSAEVAINQAITTGTHTIDFDIPSGTFPGGVFSPIYARFRLFTSAPSSPDAAAFDGEVEEYLMQATSDYGDAPKDMSSIDADLGNAYPTLLTDNGPRHTIVSGVQLGALIDGEWDGQPNLNADGDDTANLADEDGVVFNPALGLTGNVLLSGVQNELQVTASVAGYLNGWIDYNQNGSFADTGEHIFNDSAVSAGANTLNFTTPNTAPHGATYMRFRYTTGTSQANTPTGQAPNGEVEDYRVALALPEADTCNADLVNGSFEPPPTSTGALQTPSANVPGWGFRASDPASGNNFTERHSIELWTSGFNGVPAHEGVQFAEINGFVTGNLYQDMVTVPGETMHWQFAHRARLGTDVMALQIGAPDATVEVFRATTDTSAWKVYYGSYTIPPGQTITRFEFQSISTGSGSPSAGNFVDAIHFSLACDYGDAPDTNGQTIGANRAYHLISDSVYLGATAPDAEGTGVPNSAADGDDNQDQNDEDGLMGFVDPNWVDGGDIQVSVSNVSATACVYAWVDWASDGFGVGSDSTSHIEVTTDGTVIMTFPADANMPAAGSFPPSAYLRLRAVDGACSTLAQAASTPSGIAQTGLAPTGGATGGEVEDHVLHFRPNAITLQSINATNTTPTIWLVAALLAGFTTLVGVYVLRKRSL